MIAQLWTPPAEKPSSTLTLDGFCQHVGLTNPFLMDRVTQSAQAAQMDAQTVHQLEFRQLVDLAHAARDQHLAIGVMLWGEAGTGKSHLLARLARWASQDGKACFIYLQNLQPGPENLPRSLLRVAISMLTQGRQDRFNETPLYQLVESAVERTFRERTKTIEPAVACSHLLERLNAQAPSQPAIVDRTTYNVLFRFFAAARAQDDRTAELAVRWLSGDLLELEDARLIGLPLQPKREDAVALLDDQQIKLVLVALSQMALLADQPLLLCFDQVENVSPEQMEAQARFLHALLDCAPNLLVITCGFYEKLMRWQQEAVIHAACWDRLAQVEIALPRVTPLEARQIVQVRLECFVTPFLELEMVKNLVQKDLLFPLGAGWFDQFLKDKVDVRPRQVIKWARDSWSDVQRTLKTKGGRQWLQEWPGGIVPPPPPPPPPLDEIIDRAVGVELDRQKAQRQTNPETMPPDGDNLAGLLFLLLGQCCNAPRPYALVTVNKLAAPNKRQRPTFQMAVKKRRRVDEDLTGVLVLVTSNGTQTATALRRVLEDARPPERFLLVTEQRCPLRLGNKGKEYLAQLQRKFGERMGQIELTFGQYAEVDALNAVIGSAPDLEIDLPQGGCRAISESEVIASHHRCNRYAANVLLGKLLEVEVPPPPPPPPPPLDARQWIAGQLALTLGASIHELVVKYTDYLKTSQWHSLEMEQCKAFLVEVALTMHQQGHIQFTRTQDGGFLLPLRK